MQFLATILLSVMLFACGQTNAPTSTPTEAVASRMAAPAKMAVDSMMGGAEQSMTEVSEPQNVTQTDDIKKYVALRHQLNVELAVESMQENFDAALRHCEALHCQILSGGRLHGSREAVVLLMSSLLIAGTYDE